MKQIYLALGTAAVLGCTLLFAAPRMTEAAPAAGSSEYAIIQWKNDHDTQVLWPDGHVDFMATLMPNVSLPSGDVHQRAYIMTALINKLAKQGYEYAGMASGEEIVMKKVR